MSLLTFLAKHLALISNSSFFIKIKSLAIVAVMASPIAFLLEKVSGWYLLNYGYVSFVFIAIMFDHFLGTWVHGWIKKDFSLKKNIYGLFMKIILVLMVGVMTEGMAHILGKGAFITAYFVQLCKLMVFLYPAGSALVSCSIITKGKFPPTGFMEKIRNFNKKMDVDQFKKDEETSDIS